MQIFIENHTCPPPRQSRKLFNLTRRAWLEIFSSAMVIANKNRLEVRLPYLLEPVQVMIDTFWALECVTQQCLVDRLAVPPVSSPIDGIDHRFFTRVVNLFSFPWGPCIGDRIGCKWSRHVYRQHVLVTARLFDQTPTLPSRTPNLHLSLRLGE